MGIQAKSQLAGFSLEQAWLEFADYEMPALQLRERYEALLRPAVKGDPTEYPDRPWQVFEPIDRWQRGKMADQRERALRRSLFDMLGDGLLDATGLQISPGIGKRRSTIDPKFFHAAHPFGDGVDWMTGTVTVGATVFTDVRVTAPLAKPRRGRREKRSNVRDAIARVTKTDPHILDRTHGQIEKAVLNIFDSHPSLKPRGGVSAGTIARVVVELRKNQK